MVKVAYSIIIYLVSNKRYGIIKKCEMLSGLNSADRKMRKGGSESYPIC